MKRGNLFNERDYNKKNMLLDLKRRIRFFIKSLTTYLGVSLTSQNLIIKQLIKLWRLQLKNLTLYDFIVLLTRNLIETYKGNSQDYQAILRANYLLEIYKIELHISLLSFYELNNYDDIYFRSLQTRLYK